LKFQYAYMPAGVFFNKRKVSLSQRLLLSLCRFVMAFTKFLLFTFLIIYTDAPALSQVALFTCRIIDQETGEHIPYVNLGVRQKRIGTNADENGRISFRINENELEATDIWVLSSIGYEPKEITHRELLKLNTKSIHLKPNVAVLNEVSLIKSRLKYRSIGKKSHGTITHINIYGVRDSIDDGLSQEFGVILNLKKHCLIEDFNIFFSSNNFDSLLLRFHVYQVEGDSIKTRLPQSAYFLVSAPGWQKADLRSKILELPQGKYAFTAQIVDKFSSAEMPRLSVPAATPSPFNELVYRAKSQDRWQIHKSANPSIYVNALCE
jgi:hypothetical protein